MTDDRRLTAAARRRADPDNVFSGIEAAIEMGGPAERAAAAEHFRTRADSAFRLYKLAAPPIYAHEGLTEYRRRLLNGLRVYSDSLRTMDFSHTRRDQLPPFERMLIDDAVALFKKPEGQERSLTRRDQAGREITEFYGDQEASWLPFTNCIADNGEVLGWKVGRIDGTLFTGRNGPEAVARRGQEAAALKAGYAALAAASASAAGG